MNFFFIGTIPNVDSYETFLATVTMCFMYMTESLVWPFLSVLFSICYFDVYTAFFLFISVSDIWVIRNENEKDSEEMGKLVEQQSSEFLFGI